MSRRRFEVGEKVTVGVRFPAAEREGIIASVTISYMVLFTRQRLVVVVACEWPSTVMFGQLGNESRAAERRNRGNSLPASPKGQQ